MHTYRVTMQERQADGSIKTLKQLAVCESMSAVIEWYGLNNDDIVSYEIKMVDDI